MALFYDNVQSIKPGTGFESIVGQDQKLGLSNDLFISIGKFNCLISAA
ncbi:hypothetical protein [Pontibacter sp. SGAir0037]|nr:hypothetical protein [Pontibacter sp. SGAir0037]